MRRGVKFNIFEDYFFFVNSVKCHIFTLIINFYLFFLSKYRRQRTNENISKANQILQFFKFYWFHNFL
jgi:hypothetical protein